MAKIKLCRIPVDCVLTERIAVGYTSRPCRGALMVYRVDLENEPTSLVLEIERDGSPGPWGTLHLSFSTARALAAILSMPACQGLDDRKQK